MEEKTVTIKESEYNSLLIAQAKLSSLEMNGVDNWFGYGYMRETMKEYYPEEYAMEYGEDE